MRHLRVRRTTRTRPDQAKGKDEAGVSLEGSFHNVLTHSLIITVSVCQRQERVLLVERKFNTGPLKKKMLAPIWHLDITTWANRLQVVKDQGDPSM